LKIQQRGFTMVGNVTEEKRSDC